MALMGALFLLSSGLIGLAIVTTISTFTLCVIAISTGYSLAVPLLSTLFSFIPVQQGVMQGFAGSADRFGQAIGPVVALSMMQYTGENGLMWAVGIMLISITVITIPCLTTHKATEPVYQELAQSEPKALLEDERD